MTLVIYSFALSSQPWDADPDDLTLGMSIKTLKDNVELWLDNNPDMWPTASETNWRGGKFLRSRF
jgi:hypothetical protein